MRVAVQGVADGGAGDQVREGLDDLVVAAARGQDAGAEEAHLAVVGQRGREQRLPDVRQVEVGVVEDDRGGLATEFEGDRAQQRGDMPARRRGRRRWTR